VVFFWFLRTKERAGNKGEKPCFFLHLWREIILEIKEPSISRRITSFFSPALKFLECNNGKTHTHTHTHVHTPNTIKFYFDQNELWFGFGCNFFVLRTLWIDKSASAVTLYTSSNSIHLWYFVFCDHEIPKKKEGLKHFIWDSSFQRDKWPIIECMHLEIMNKKR